VRPPPYRSLLLLALLAAATPADGKEADAGADRDWAAKGRNDMAVFLGATAVRGDLGESVGLDYEYRVTRRFGVGAALEYTGAAFRELLYAVSFDWHPWREMKLYLAPGGQTDVTEGTAAWVVRFGIEYGFDVGRGLEIAPALSIDHLSDETAVVIGVGLGRSF
jgi:hypothetical protein